MCTPLQSPQHMLKFQKLKAYRDMNLGQKDILGLDLSMPIDGRSYLGTFLALLVHNNTVDLITCIENFNIHPV